MKKLEFLMVLGLFLALGCATVKVQAPKEPIKVDISMRLDVYQHVQKDIDAIENIVTGSGEKEKPQSLFNFSAGTVYAQDLSPEVEEAALRRKARYAELYSLEETGAVGEDSSGLARVRKPADASVEGLVNNENSDRMIIYTEISEKNGTAVEDVQKIYAERLQNNAPSGTPIEIGTGNWQIK